MLRCVVVVVVVVFLFVCLFLMNLFLVAFIAIARTAQGEETSTAVTTNPSLSTVENRNSVEGRQLSVLLRLVTICAIILLSHYSE